MAMHENEEQTEHPQQLNSLFPLDSLFCEEEERWEDDDDEDSFNEKNSSFLPFASFKEHLFHDDNGLLSLLSKEKEQHHQNLGFTDPNLSRARSEAVDWILKVNSCYGFTALTAILAVDYLNRFLSSFHYQRDKPWMIQLVSVTCLSLAAKVEEIQVPLLLDLQVHSKYIFEAKTIQRMELLVLSALQWKMHPLTPLSFLHHFIQSLGLTNSPFLRLSENLLLSVVSDSRTVGYHHSVLATATMMRIIDQIEPRNPIEYKDQLLDAVQVNKEKANECYSLILELSKINAVETNNHLKRKHDRVDHGSPRGVVESCFSSDSSNDSWEVAGSTSVYSSPSDPAVKKTRSDDQRLELHAALKQVFVDIIGSLP